MNNITIEDKINWVKALRRHEFEQTSWMFERHMMEKELVSKKIIEKTTLTDYKFKQWLEYWQYLRNITNEITVDDEFDISKTPEVFKRPK